MTNTILIKRSSTPTSVPSPGDLVPGELAINFADGNLFFENSAGNIQTIASTQFVSVTGNVTGGNIITLGQVSATGNVTGNYFIGNGALLTGIQSGFLSGTVDDFVGDGSTLAFTLSVIPSSENLTSVNINGVSQLKTAYSVAGNVITFTSAPVNGSDVEVTTLSGSATSLANLVNGTTIIDIPVADGNATVSVSGNANVGVFTANGLVVNGSIEATNGFIGLDATAIGNGTANVRTFLNANVTISAEGNANIVTVTGTGATVAGTLSASGNVTGGNIITSGLVSANTLSIANTASISGNLNMNSQNITSLANPVNAQDAVTKVYVDELVARGIHFHEPVRVESPINLVATYNNGTSGVGATLTNSGTQAALVIDGVTMVVADRVLVYEQTDQTQNGIYVVTDIGSVSTNWILTRATDADTYVIDSPNGLSEGSTFFVQEGTTGAGETYTCNTVGTIVFGTTNITFTQISSAQIYSAGAGLALAGTTFSITVATPINVIGITNAGANGVGNIGSSSGYFDTVFAKATSAQYADLAELYHADAAYSPGTVLDFGGTYEVTRSLVDASRQVAGVVSTRPAYLMNSTATGEHMIALALAGRVPVSVTGTIKKGDMLVSAGNGVARAEPEPKLGTVIGKAVQNFSGDSGVIEVVIGQY
jgi:hypothetical protein